MSVRSYRSNNTVNSVLNRFRQLQDETDPRPNLPPRPPSLIHPTNQNKNTNPQNKPLYSNIDTRHNRRRRSSNSDYSDASKLMNQQDLHRYKVIKVKPKELTKNIEFRLWYQKFFRYINNFSFSSAFRLDNLTKITDSNLANFCRYILDGWLDDKHHKILFETDDPSNCMIRLTHYRKPQDKLADVRVLSRKIGTMGYYPRE